MVYPDNCIKGIPNNTFVLGDGSVASHFFEFKENSARQDGLHEQSINWEDDESVIEFTLNQKKDNGECKYKSGVAILERYEIDRLSNRPTVNKVLSYERNIISGNKYHGNILINSNVPKPAQRKIAAGLALAVSAVIEQEET